MKLTGRISIDLEVESFIEAGQHEERLEALLALVRERYPQANLVLAERRGRRDFTLPSVEAPANLARYRAGRG